MQAPARSEGAPAPCVNKPKPSPGVASRPKHARCLDCAWSVAQRVGCCRAFQLFHLFPPPPPEALDSLLYHFLLAHHFFTAALLQPIITCDPQFPRSDLRIIVKADEPNVDCRFRNCRSAFHNAAPRNERLPAQLHPSRRALQSWSCSRLILDCLTTLKSDAGRRSLGIGRLLSSTDIQGIL